VVDGHGSVEEVHERVRDLVKTALPETFGPRLV
jgi:hypothetical protein